MHKMRTLVSIGYYWLPLARLLRKKNLTGTSQYVSRIEESSMQKLSSCHVRRRPKIKEDAPFF